MVHCNNGTLPKIGRMSESPKRCAFVVIKLLAYGESFILLKHDRDWGDYNFPGGHERESDGGSLDRTAKRELLEEISQLRDVRSTIDLNPLTGELSFGPVYSRSTGKVSRYCMQFYVLTFSMPPSVLHEVFATGRGNALVPIREMQASRLEESGISKLAELLNKSVSGGLRAIPYSWRDDVCQILDRDALERITKRQLDIAWPAADSHSEEE